MRMLQVSVKCDIKCDAGFIKEKRVFLNSEECENEMFLVLTVLNGEHFPRRLNWQLSVTAHFNGESLSTDPIDHISSPNFDTELAWEVDRRQLNFLKMQKTPVKLQCFARDKLLQTTESVGYVVLDLTLAKQPIMKPKWFGLLNSKYAGKPRVQLTLGLEDDIPIDKPKDTTVNDKKDEETEVAEHVDYTPVMVEKGAYYQIGPQNTAKDFFTFSVTIGFASNLDKLVSYHSSLPSEHDGFFFFYTLLGNDIFTDPFSDLARANFSAERATVQLRSSVIALRAFFCNEMKIQVHLCCGDRSLGRANVPLTELIPANQQTLEQPIAVEDVYELKTSRQSQMTDVPEAIRPTVAIVLILTKEKVDIMDPHTSDGSLESGSPPNVRRNLQYPQTPPQKLEKEIRPSESARPVKVPSEEMMSDKLPELPVTPKSNEVFKIAAETDESTSLGPLVTYNFSVDLRTIKNIMVDTPFNCYLRYSYTYFGDVAPVVTHPTVDVRQNCSSILPHGYSAFRFMAKPEHLEEVFRKNPIKVEVLHRSTSAGPLQDKVVGVSLLHLGHLLDAEKSITVDENGQTASRQVVLSTIPVISKEFHGKVAEIQLSIALDNYGRSRQETSEKGLQPQAVPDSPMVQQRSWEDKLSEQAAVEIEQWKQTQEAHFMKELLDKETKHLEEITSEWTAREMERELLVQKKITEYQNLEDKLTKALSNVEKKERQLILNEAENQKMKNDLQLDYERLMIELKDTARRYKEEYSHKIELEKNKSKSLQEQCTRLQKHSNELEKKLEIRELAHQAYQEQKQQPEIKLRSELNLLQMEKAELERKVQSLTKSKIHYKQQYGSCLRELARLKQAMQSEAQAQLRIQKQELEQMRTQLITSNMNQQVTGGNAHTVLDELKLDLAKKSTNCATEPRTSLDESQQSRNKSGRNISKPEETELVRLLNERDTLMRTGCYAPEDQIIDQLDKAINRIILREK